MKHNFIHSSPQALSPHTSHSYSAVLLYSRNECHQTFSAVTPL